MSVRLALKRELRVAFSRRAQPVWVRVLKWTVLIGIGVRLWRTPYFWPTFLGLLALGITVHLIWRWKTKVWTQPWIGWIDLEAGRDPEPPDVRSAH